MIARTTIRGVYLGVALLVLGSCGGDGDSAGSSTGGAAAAIEEPAAPATSEPLVPADRAAKVALGTAHASARELYDTLRQRAGGGAPLDLDDMPDWSGLWTRIGRPFFDPEQEFTEITRAHLKPAALEELTQRRELSAQGIEYDPISDCSPPGFPRWLVIPFLREFIVTPRQVWLTSETVNNIRRIYTDGRDHPPADDAYPLWYGDSIGFWSGHTLVIHTSQIRENVFHRNDPRHSDQIEVVEVWNKTDDETILVDVWAYDPVTLEEPWYTQQTYKRVPNPDGYLRVRYWHCSENPNNAIVETEEGSSQFQDFDFTEEDN
jgi:hypothetical protein